MKRFLKFLLQNIFAIKESKRKIHKEFIKTLNCLWMYIFNIFLLIYETISKIFDKNLLCCWNINEYKIRFTPSTAVYLLQTTKEVGSQKIIQYGFKAEFK